MSLFITRGKTAMAMVLAGLLLSACGGTFATDYIESSPVEARSQWKAARVKVVIPPGLTTTEANSYMPNADIVWHGDPVGNRGAQVATIVEDGISAGVARLNGPQAVVLTATLVRFHSLTPKAYHAAPSGTGVHSVEFDLVVSDAKTGAVLSGPVRIEADMPALVAADDPKAVPGLPGDRWKSVIESHIAATMRSWLGIGPDIRNRFSRMGA